MDKNPRLIAKQITDLAKRNRRLRLMKRPPDTRSGENLTALIAVASTRLLELKSLYTEARGLMSDCQDSATDGAERTQNEALWRDARNLALNIAGKWQQQEKALQELKAQPNPN